MLENQFSAVQTFICGGLGEIAGGHVHSLAILCPGSEGKARVEATSRSQREQFAIPRAHTRAISHYYFHNHPRWDLAKQTALRRPFTVTRTVRPALRRRRPARHSDEALDCLRIRVGTAMAHLGS